MRILVVGCGRVGSLLAARLASNGHDVRVIDRDPRSRRLLPVNYAGTWLAGGGFSRAVLESAGITQADALVAVTNDDNVNIVAARTAKDVYRVPQVVAGIAEPRRAEVCHRLGIPTVAGVIWTVGQLSRMLLHRDLAPELSFGNGETLLVRSELPRYLTGRRLRDFEVSGEIRVVEVTRGGHSTLPETTTVAVPGDLVTFAVATTALTRLGGFLGKELGA